MNFDAMVARLRSVFGHARRNWGYASDARDDASFCEDVHWRSRRMGVWVLIERLGPDLTWIQFHNERTGTEVECFNPTNSLVSRLCFEAIRENRMQR